jgi:hypothetical protein
MSELWGVLRHVRQAWHAVPALARFWAGLFPTSSAGELSCRILLGPASMLWVT